MIRVWVSWLSFDKTEHTFHQSIEGSILCKNTKVWKFKWKINRKMQIYFYYAYLFVSSTFPSNTYCPCIICIMHTTVGCITANTTFFRSSLLSWLISNISSITPESGSLRPDVSSRVLYYGLISWGYFILNATSQYHGTRPSAEPR